MTEKQKEEFIRLRDDVVHAFDEYASAKFEFENSATNDHTLKAEMNRKYTDWQNTLKHL